MDLLSFESSIISRARFLNNLRYNMKRTNLICDINHVPSPRKLKKRLQNCNDMKQKNVFRRLLNRALANDRPRDSMYLYELLN